MRRLFRLGNGPGQIDRDVDDELAFHVDMRARKLAESGLAPDAATREALRHFGDLRRVHASCVSLDLDRERTMKRVRYADELRQDFSFALRALRRNPAFALVAIFTLAIGIGANSAIFSLIDAIMLRPIPVRAPQELVAIGDPARVNSTNGGTPTYSILSWPLYRDIATQRTDFSGVLASGRAGRLEVRIDGSTAEAEHPLSRFVSANYFSVLGVPAEAGRVFGPVEDGLGNNAPAAVISDRYWTMRFARDPRVIGKVIRVNDAQITIIGVTPPGFDGEVVGAQYALWLPLNMYAAIKPHESTIDNRERSFLLAMGRLAPGVSRSHADASLRQFMARTMIDHARTPDDAADIRGDTALINDGAHGFSRVRRTFSTPLFTMLAGVGLLLMIICANVANLLLARAVARTPEFSVRLAMGAGRARLLRQLLTESGVLAVLSAIVGLALAWFGGRGLLVLASDGSTTGNIPLDLRMDPRVLLFTFGLALVAVVLFGLLPAFRASRLDLAGNLRARGVIGGLATRGQRFPIGTMMIAGQIALSLVMLMGAGLLMRSLSSIEQTQVGLDRDHLLMVSVGASDRGYRGPALQELTRALQQRLTQLPGVTQVTYSENGIFNGSESRIGVDVPNWVGKTGDDSVSSEDQVGAHYIAGIGGRLLAGRDMEQRDIASGAAHVALVNQSFARFYFGARNAVGQIFRVNDTVPVEIIGVVADVHDHALDAPPERRFYVPYATIPSLSGPEDLNFAVRTSGDPERSIAGVKREIELQDASLIIFGSTPLALLMRQSIVEQRLLARVASGFGILALLLSAIGLYGVMTYAVTRRTGEIGLRIALGGAPGRMVALVIRDALVLVALGIGLGVPLAWGASKLLGSELHGVTATDPLSALLALGVLTAAALLAAFIPARRAARVDPLVALRQY